MADLLDDDEHWLQETIDEQPEQVERSKTDEKTPAKKKNKEKKRKRASFSDLIDVFRVHFHKSKSQFEMDEILSNFPSTLDVSPKKFDGLESLLDEIVPTKFWTKNVELKSSPVVLIVCQSALRCIELGNSLKKSSAAGNFKFHYLFAKHKKLNDQIEFLRQGKSSFNIVFSTPKRLDDVLESKALNLKRLKFVFVDWNYENVKKQRLIDLKQLKEEICHLFCQQNSLKKRFHAEKTRIGLF